MTLDDSLTALAIATTLGILAALTILTATAYLMVCRSIEAHRRVRSRHDHTAAAEQDQAAIEQAGHDPQPMLDAIRDLHEACCDRWWTSLATDHDPTCPNQTRKEAR